MAVTLVQSTVTNFNTSNQSTAQTASLTGVTANDTLVVGVAMMNAVGASVKSVTTTSGSTSPWTQINISQFSAQGVDTEWWYTTCTGTGTVQVSVLPANSCEFGLFFGELDSGSTGLATGTPVSGMTDVGLSASVQYTAMTVSSSGSWVAVNSVTNFAAETNANGLGTFNAGPTNSGTQYAGLTYGNASSTTASATGWTSPSARWVTAGIVVPPGQTAVNVAASVNSSSSVSATVTVNVGTKVPIAASVNSQSSLAGTLSFSLVPGLAQQANGASNGSASTATITLGNAVTVGNFLTAQICLPTASSVVSITDSQFNRWIQCANASSSGGNAEIWYARGVRAGSTVATVTLSSSASVGVNISEWANVWYVDPLDQWSANFGTSASPAINTLTTRSTADLVIGVQSGASVNGPPSGWTALTETGSHAYAAAYEVAANAGSVGAQWTGSSSASTWAVAAACFVTGVAGSNPHLQFPETLVEMSTTNNYLAPLSGIGVWTNISSYVRNMSFGPLGRQHELDRVQATPATFTVTNRTGVFNTWNTTSFLYNNGYGMKPMNPVKVTAAWNGITSPQYYGYLQSITPKIGDVLNVDAMIDCIDILQMLSLKYLTNDNYAQQVIADGGANLGAYYRLGDQIGSFSVIDSSGNGNTGSLISGIGGDPAFGGSGFFLYDANTSLDLTNGTNLPNGGFFTDDNSTQPPTRHAPIASSSWTLEGWLKWTGSTVPSFSGGLVPNRVLFHTPGIGFPIIELQAGFIVNPFNYPNSIPQNQLILIWASSPSAFSYALTVDGPNIFDGNMHYFAVGVISNGGDTAASVYFVIDGVMVNGVQTVTGQLGFPNDIYIGTPPQGQNGYDLTGAANYAVPFDGTIQDVALYTAASPTISIAMLNNHYNIGKWFQSTEFGASVGTSSAARFNKVLQVSGLSPSLMLQVPYQFRTLLYAETNTVTTTSGLNYMQTQTETEPGVIFQGPNGLIYAYNRQYQYLNPTSTTSQATFSDSANSPYFYDGPSLQISGDDLDIWNDIQVQSGRGGLQLSASSQDEPGSAQTFTEAPSEVGGEALQEWGPIQSNAAAQSASVYGQRTLQGLTSLQEQYDSDALAMAQNYGEWYNFPIDRVTQMTLNSQGNGGVNLVQILQRALMDRITIQYTGQTPGPTFSQDSLIEQIRHDVNIEQPTWVTSYAMSPYEILMYPTYLGVWKFGNPASDGVLTL